MSTEVLKLMRAAHQRLPKDDPVARRDALFGIFKYERDKRQWALNHPAATQAEYEAAIKRIADECGV